MKQSIGESAGGSGEGKTRAKGGRKPPLEVVTPSESRGRGRPTAETRNQFIALRAENKSQRECAKTLGIGRSTAERWDKKYEAQIRQQRARDADHFQEARYQMREARIEAMTKIADKCLEIVEHSDLVPEDTNQLMRVAQVALEAFDRIRQEFPAATGDTAQEGGPGSSLAAFLDRVYRTDQAETFQKIMGHVSDVLVARIADERGIDFPDRQKPTDPPPDLPSPEEFLQKMAAKEAEQETQ